MVRDRLRSLFVGMTVLTMAGGVVLTPVAAEFDAHITIDDPAALTAEDAEKIYGELLETLTSGYERASYEKARGYETWRRYNTVPYLSATHGNRFVNNYGDWRATGYESLGPGDKLAEGTVLAKDSFTVREDGTVLPAPLFIMEKLAAGSSPDSGDWRYVMILPDGSVFGDTHGQGAGRMGFCHECHEAVEDTDFVFYVPEEFRAAE